MLRLTLALSILFALVACKPEVRADTGSDGWLFVKGGQFVRGAMPDSNAGPTAMPNLTQNSVRAGQIEEPFSGTLSQDASAAAIALAGDVGYWILPAGVPNELQADNAPTFSTLLSFARHTPPGDHALLVRAVDAGKRFGPAASAKLTVLPEAMPNGKLVVQLSWSSEADLDLHVVDPSGVEIWNGNLNSYQPPPPGQTPPPPGAWKDGGIFEGDSNAACNLDGDRAEDVVWGATPPSGHYVVRVDTFSLCGEVRADWRVDAVLQGRVVASAQGASFDSDTRFAHGPGAGVLALEFDVP